MSRRVDALAKRGSILGGVLAALALALLLASCGGSDPKPTSADVSVDSTATIDATIRFWRQRAQRDPRDFISYNKLADAYIRRARQTGDVGDYDRAEAALTASLESLPTENYEALVQLSLVYGAQHEFADALTLAERAVALRPGKPFGYAVLGDAQLALGKYEEGAESYNTMTGMAPGLASFSRFAYLLELRGDLEGAELMWRNAVRIDGGRLPENSAWARVQLGHFYFKTGDLRAAETAYNHALEAVPTYVHALAGLANVRAARSEYDEAVALYGDVVARYPTPEYVIAFGDILQVAGRVEEAARQYALVDAIDQLYKANGINTDLQMALFFADHDVRLDEALLQARAVYEDRPSIQAADALAWALYKRGRHAEALDYAREALRLGTKDARMLFHAGMIHYALGDDDEARGYLERTTELNPHFSWLYRDEADRLLRTLQSSVRAQ